jgi:hypothetical protein
MNDKNTLRRNKVNLLLLSILAISAIITPLATATWFGLCPQYGDPGCPGHNTALALQAYRSAPSPLLDIFYMINFILPYIAPLVFVMFGLVAMEKRPWLGLIGMITGWLGSIVPWGIIFNQTVLYASAARLHNDQAFAQLQTAFGTNPYVVAAAVGWAMHLLGYLVLGIALLGNNAVPKWAGVSLIVATVAMGPLAYGTNQNWLQVGGYILVAIVAFPVARALLCRP